MLGAPRDVLPTGVFLASVVRRAELDSFLLAQWTAACVQHIEPHVHAEAHFMLVTSGRYATTARGDCSSGKYTAGKDPVLEYVLAAPPS